MAELAIEAERASGPRNEPATSTGIQEALRPVIQSLVALGRAVAANSAAVARIEERLAAQESFRGTLASLQSSLEEKRAMNARLFDAMHEEMRGYKDGFLFETIQKPVARDLITLWDDLTATHKRIREFLEKPLTDPDTMVREVHHLGEHVDHATHAILEILGRLDVALVDPVTQKHDRTVQKAVAVEPAADASEDGAVVKSLRPGFTWRGRIIRPEEVVIKKFRPEPDSAAAAGANPPAPYA